MDAWLADGETMGLKSYYYILNNISRATIYLKIVDGRVVRNMKGTKSFIRPQGNVVIRRYVSVEHSLGDFEFSLTSIIVG
jgi:hypothetical protein